MRHISGKRQLLWLFFIIGSVITWELWRAYYYEISHISANHTFPFRNCYTMFTFSGECLARFVWFLFNRKVKFSPVFCFTLVLGLFDQRIQTYDTEKRNSKLLGVVNVKKLGKSILSISFGIIHNYLLTLRGCLLTIFCSLYNGHKLIASALFCW